MSSSSDFEIEDDDFSTDVGRRISTFRNSKNAICSGTIIAYDAVNDLHTITFEDGVDEILSLDSYRLLGALSDTSNYAVGQQKNNKRSRDDVSSSNSTVVAAEAKRRNHHLDDDTGVANSTANDDDDDDDDLADVMRQIRVGDRLARDFDGTIYFGQVEVCHKRKNNNEAQPLFDVLFDDGDFFRLELDDVSASLKLYEACRLKEKNDPQIQSKIKAMETEFHENKQQILRQLPTEMKSQFLQIGFAKFADHRSEYMPVLFLSPFHVAWSVRQAWLDKFQRAKSTTGYKDFPRLVYWYGEKSLEKSFSFVKMKRCLSYEEACKKGVVAGMPKDIQRKVRKRKKLGKNEQRVYNLWKTLEEELDKSPADRIIFEKPKEDHELVASGERLFMEIEAELDRFTKTSDVL